MVDGDEEGVEGSTFGPERGRIWRGIEAEEVPGSLGQSVFDASTGEKRGRTGG